jgi:hypothetical protein
VRIPEAFFTPLDPSDDVASPAAWRRPEGEVLLLATAKATHLVLVYDGASGTPLGRVGGPGSGKGEFRRPNGILVHEEEGVLKVYDLEGAFTGVRLGKDIFVGEPEGFPLYSCGAEGYLVAADQSHRRNRFQLFQRRSMDLLGSFRGEKVSNTDGVPILQGEVAGLTGGAFCAVYDDQGVAAFSWASVAEALGLRGDCEAEWPMELQAS